MAVYQILKAGGLSDADIYLMQAEDTITSPHNSFVGHQYIETPTDQRNRRTLFTADTHVDLWGSAVTAQCFLAALTGVPRRGCAPPPLPPPNSTLFIYMNGHGAEGLLKFRDNAELTSAQLATGLLAAKAAGRFNRALLVLDTCHAESILQHIPAATATGSKHEQRSNAAQRAFAAGVQDSLRLLDSCSDDASLVCSAAASLISALPASMAWLQVPIARFAAYLLQQWDPLNSVPVPPLNINIVATSSWEKSSYAAGFDADLGTPLADGFVTTLFRRTLSPKTEHYGRQLHKLTSTLDSALQQEQPERPRTPPKRSSEQSFERLWGRSAMRYFVGLPVDEVGSQCVVRADHGSGAGMQPLTLQEALTQPSVVRAVRQGAATVPA